MTTMKSPTKLQATAEAVSKSRSGSASTLSSSRRSVKSEAPRAATSPAAVKPLASVPTGTGVPKAFLALAVEAGIFLIGALPEGASKISGLGFFANGEDKFVLCCAPAKGGILLIDNKAFTESGARDARLGSLAEHKFLGFLPIPAKLLKPNVVLHFGAVQEDGTRTRFRIALSSMQTLDDSVRQSVLREYRHLFVPAVTALMPAEHPLSKAIGASVAATAAQGPLRAVPAVAPAVAQGFFDEIVEGRAEGWAFNPADPKQRLVIEIMAGTRVVARGLADGFRADLLQAGVGDGRYCFKLPISYELRDGKPHKLTARVATTGQALRIKGGGDSHVFAHAPASGPAFDFIPTAVAHQLVSAIASNIKELPRPKELALAFGVAHLHLETRELNGAARGFLDLLHKFGEQALFFCKVAESYVLGGRYQDAVNIYRKASECSPEFGWAWLGLAGAQRLLRAWPEAEASYRKAVELMPDHAGASKRLAQALIDGGKAAAAKDVLKTHLLKHPLDEEACGLFEKLVCADAGRVCQGESDGNNKELMAFEAARQLLELALDSAEALLETRK